MSSFSCDIIFSSLPSPALVTMILSRSWMLDGVIDALPSVFMPIVSATYLVAFFSTVITNGPVCSSSVEVNVLNVRVSAVVIFVNSLIVLAVLQVNVSASLRLWVVTPSSTVNATGDAATSSKLNIYLTAATLLLLSFLFSSLR